MPFPLIAVGAGLAGAGVLSSLFGRPKRLRESDLTTQAEGDIRSFLSELQNPDIRVFERLAARSAGSPQSFLAALTAQGGSGIQADIQFRRSQRQSFDAALDAYLAQQQQNTGMRANLMGQLLGAEQTRRYALAQNKQDRRQFFASLGNQLLGLGGTMMGQGAYLGSPNRVTQGQQSPGQTSGQIYQGPYPFPGFPGVPTNIPGMTSLTARNPGLRAPVGISNFFD